MNQTERPGAQRLLRSTGNGDAGIVNAGVVNAGNVGTLLERYRNYLTLLARVQIGRRLQAKLDPADVVQEVFLRAHDRIAQFRGHTEAQFVAWIRQILATRLAELVRHYYGTDCRNVRLEQELIVQLDESSCDLERTLVAPGSSPSQQAARREQAVILAEALAQLPAHYREVIILHQLEDLSFPDVASRMGRSVDSVKNLWIRALARLRRLLKGAV
jgi:RNA polymerase sigma-70 factor (ECF subfamily)